MKRLFRNFIRVVGLLKKRVTCRHLYKVSAELTARNFITDKRIILSTTFECVHCGKRLYVERDEDTQIKQNEEL